MEFLGIPVMINGNIQYVNYKYSDKDQYGQACHITSLDKEMVVDEDFVIIESDMPENWIEPIFNTLKTLLKIER